MKKIFYRAKDIKEILGICENKAYQIIRDLNEELREKGFLTQQGRVNVEYFNERFNIGRWCFMPQYKDNEKNTWFCEFWYRDYDNVNKKKKKRGFKTKKEALAWEVNFKNQISGKTEMLFSDLFENYIEDMKHRCKFSTIKLKKSIYRNNLESFFSSYKLNEITPVIIRKWQNEQIKKSYQPTYLRTLNKELTSIFNFAIKFYHLKNNPCSIAGNIGNKKPEKECEIWSPEEFEKFISLIDNLTIKTAFITLFFTGMRVGELLALYFEDIDLENRTIKITKTKYDNVIGKTKTKGSNRIIKIPENLRIILNDYTDKIYKPGKKQLLFDISRTLLIYYMRTYSIKAGVKKIRIHDLRHSHASYLISKHISIVAVSKRLGHSSIKTTLDTYAHLFKDSNEELIEVLENIKL